jgi:primosomal protein N'
VTKGLHIPNLTLVGVVDAISACPEGDLRAAERSFQQSARYPGAPGAAKPAGSLSRPTNLRRP